MGLGAPIDPGGTLAFLFAALTNSVLKGAGVEGVVSCCSQVMARNIKRQEQIE